MGRKKLDDLTAELEWFYGSFMGGREHFTYIYGSHATGYAKEGSDLDVVTICNSVTKDEVLAIRDFIVDFHHRHKLGIDEEVPFERKLVCSYHLMDEAVTGKGFHFQNGTYTVPILETTAEYLSSDELMQRLLLNTITSRSICVAGNGEQYNHYKREGWATLIDVVFNIAGYSPMSYDEFVENLVQKNGRFGRDYMGYVDKDPVRKHLLGEVKRYFDVAKDEGKISQDGEKYMYLRHLGD